MKRTFVILSSVLCLLSSAPAADLYVFSRDGATPASGPRELPANAVELATRRQVLGLHAAAPVVQASCGWYRVRPDTNAVPAGMRVSSRSFTLTNFEAVESVTYTNRPDRTLRLRGQVAAIRASTTNTVAQKTAACIDAIVDHLQPRADK